MPLNWYCLVSVMSIKSILKDTTKQYNTRMLVSNNIWIRLRSNRYDFRPTRHNANYGAGVGCADKLDIV